MKPICIIPARAGSKRLPRKNILPYNGDPLIAHVIRNARNSNVFGEIIVSSEDRKILKIAKNSGATLHRREQELADDRSTVVHVCLDVLTKWQAEKFCCIYPTAVLLSVHTIQETYRVFERYSCDDATVLMGVSHYNYPPVQALSIDADRNGTALFPEFKAIQSQFYPDTRVSNGSIYWGRTAAFQVEETFYSKKLKLFDVPDDEISDINTLADYERLLRRSPP